MMPVRVPDYQARFTWRLDPAGVPVADVILLGAIPYVAACPLCGCFHELPQDAQEGQHTTPRCLLREYAGTKRMKAQVAPWLAIYRRWLDRHPDAAQHQQISVRLTTLEALRQRPAPDKDIRHVSKKARAA